MNSFPSRSAAKQTKTLLPSSVCANKQKARETRAACFTASREHVQEGSNPSTALYIKLCKWEFLWLAKASRPPDGVTHSGQSGQKASTAPRHRAGAFVSPSSRNVAATSCFFVSKETSDMTEFKTYNNNLSTMHGSMFGSVIGEWLFLINMNHVRLNSSQCCLLCDRFTSLLFTTVKQTTASDQWTKISSETELHA